MMLDVLALFKVLVVCELLVSSVKRGYNTHFRTLTQSCVVMIGWGSVKSDDTTLCLLSLRTEWQRQKEI